MDQPVHVDDVRVFFTIVASVLLDLAGTCWHLHPRLHCESDLFTVYLCKVPPATSHTEVAFLRHAIFARIYLCRILPSTQPPTLRSCIQLASTVPGDTLDSAPVDITRPLCIQQASSDAPPAAWSGHDTHACTQALEELLESDAKYGFIVMDGNGSLFGTLSGNTREVLHKFTVDLPKKHGRGGQSALRFARLRLEKRHNYVRKVAETSVQMFITDGQRPNVAGLVVAGSAEFKDKLIDSEMFDPRLKAIILCVVDVSYGAALSHSTP